MPDISSHILDSVSGHSATGIRVQLLRLGSDGKRESVFDLFSDAEGRILQSVEISGSEQDFELVFHSSDYFSGNQNNPATEQAIKNVLVRFSMRNREKRYHIPLLLSPHSYTVWWSE